MRTLDLEGVKDILAGFAILGSGGGGSAKSALRRLEETAAACDFTLAQLDELGAGAHLACVGGIGALAVGEDEVYERLPRAAVHPAVLAIEALAAHQGHGLDALLTGEIGVEALSDAWCPAAERGLPLVDADPIGRAVPEVQHSLFTAHGVSITPQAVATEVGDTMIVTNVADDERSERLLRAMATVSGNVVYAVDHPGTVAELRDALIPGAVSWAEQIGATLHAAASRGDDAAAAAAAAAGGSVRFRGVITTAEIEDRDGFTFGETRLTGAGDDAGADYRIWLKNENLLAWRDGDADVTTPDVISLVDDHGEVLLNPCDEYVGRAVAVVAIPAPPQLRSAEMLELMGPRSFGFDVEYRPVGTGRRGP
jgi:DUF917 family protein